MLINSIFIGNKQPTKALAAEAEEKWNWYIKSIKKPNKPEDTFNWVQKVFTLYDTHINDYLFEMLQKYDLVVSQFPIILLNEIVYLNKCYVDPSNGFIKHFNITGEKLIIHLDDKTSGVLFCKNRENDRVNNIVYSAYEVGIRN